MSPSGMEFPLMFVFINIIQNIFVHFKQIFDSNKTHTLNFYINKEPASKKKWKYKKEINEKKM